MTGEKKVIKEKPTLIKRIWNNFVPIIVFCIFLQVFLNILFYYNDPTWDFARYGPGVFIATVFPLIWLAIYFWCKAIARKKHQERGSDT